MLEKLLLCQQLLRTFEREIISAGYLNSASRLRDILDIFGGIIIYKFEKKE